MALTATYKDNTLTISKATKGTDNHLQFGTNYGAETNSATLAAYAATGYYTAAIGTLDASKATQDFQVTVNSGISGDNLVDIAAGKKNDSIYIGIGTNALTIATGAGKDTVAVMGTGATIDLTDYTPGSDVIQLGSMFAPASLQSFTFSETAANSDYTFSATNVNGIKFRLGTSEAALGTSAAMLNLKGAKDKRVTIVDSKGDIVFDQAFENSRDYNITDTNSGSIVKVTEATYIDASQRKKNNLNLIVDKANATVVAGAKNDTITAAEGGYISGGKGNDVFVVSNSIGTAAATGTPGLVIADYEFGKDTIMATGDYSTLGGYYVTDYDDDGKANDVVLQFTTGVALSTSDKNWAEVVVLNGKWDQVAKESKNWIKVVNSKGDSITASDSPLRQGYRDPSEVVVDTTQWKGANKSVVAQAKAGLELDTLTTLAGATAAFGTANTSVHTLTFSGKNAVKETAGISMSRINGANGKDTLYGSASSSLVIDSGTEASAVTNSTVSYTNGENGFAIAEGDNDSKGNKVYNVNLTGTNMAQATFSLHVNAAGNVVSVEAGTGTTLASDYKSVYAQNSTTATTYNFNKAINTLTGINNVATAGSQIGGVSYIGGKIAEAVKLTLDGGTGNDFIYGYNSGGSMLGGVGNDTLRGGSGSTKAEGGAGNDTFLLTGGTGAMEIGDYYSGSAGLQETKADAAANKKAYGSDKLVVAYDTNYKKMNELSAQSYIVGGGYESGVLNVEVEGTGWNNNGGAGFVYSEKDYGFGTTATIAGDFSNNLQSSSYNIVLPEGSYITLVEKGITYKQNVGAFGTTAAAQSQTVNANYMGLVADSRITTLNGADSKKAMRLVAGNSIAQVTGGAKADTLIGGMTSSGQFSTTGSYLGTAGEDDVSVSLTGGKGNDIFMPSNGAVLTDYSVDKGNSDKILLDDWSQLSAYENSTSGDNLVIGGFTVAGGAKSGVTPTFNVINETPVWKQDSKTKAYSISSMKKTTEVMTRGFSTTATVQAIGASTYFETFEDLDANLKNINGAKKAVHIVNGADGVVSITGSAKADTIEVGELGDGANAGGYILGSNAEFAKLGFGTQDTDTAANHGITVASGKGNDVIFWNGNSNVVISDYTSAVANTAAKKKDQLKSGDVIVFKGNDYSKLGTTADALSANYSYKGSDLIITLGTNAGATKDAPTGTLTIKNIKDGKFVFTDSYKVGDTISAIEALNPHEYKLDKSATGVTSGTTYGTGVIGTASTESVTTIVNAAAVTSKAISINLTTAAVGEGSRVATVYGGNKVDTIVAGEYTNYINAGKGNDVIAATVASAALSTSDDYDAVLGANHRSAFATAGKVGTTEGAITLYGGAGKDIFDLSGVNANADVVIMDYEVGQDKLYFGIGTDAKKDLVAIKGATFTTLDGSDGGMFTVASGKKNATLGAVDFELTNGRIVRVQSAAYKNAITSANAKLSIVDDTIASSSKYFDMTYGSQNVTLTGSNTMTNFDLSGAGQFSTNASGNYTFGSAALNVTIADVKTKAQVSVVGAASGSTIGSSGNKKSTTTFIGMTTAALGTSAGANYIGGTKNDVYVGNGAKDVVNFAAGGTNTVYGGAASITGGSGADVFVVGGTVGSYLTGVVGDVADNQFQIASLASNDKLASAVGATVQSAQFSSGALTFTYKLGTGDNDYSAVKISNYTAGDKISLADITTNSKGKIALTDYLVQGYGQATQSVANSDSDTIDTTGVYSGLYPGVTALNASGATKAKTLIFGTAITQAVGGSGADNITANMGASDVSVTGGNGADFFHIAFGTSTADLAAHATATITDFTYNSNAKKSDAVSLTGGDAGSSWSIADYGDNYDFTNSNKDVIVHFGTNDVYFKDAGDGSSKGATANLRVNGTDYLVSDKVNVVLSAKATTKSFDDANITSLDASKSASAVSLTLGTNNTVFNNFVGSKLGDNLNFGQAGDSNTNTISATLGAGNDNVTVGGGTLNINYTGGADKITGDISKVNISNATWTSLSAGSVTTGFTATSAQTAREHDYDDAGSAFYAIGTASINDVTLAAKGTSNTVQLSNTANVATITQTITRTTNTAGNAAQFGTDGTTVVTAAKASTYDWTRVFKIRTVNGIEFDYATETSKNSATNPWSSAVTAASYTERSEFFSEAVDDFVPQEVDELSAITTKTADEAAVAVDYSVDYTGGAAADATAEIASASQAAASKKKLE